MSTNLYWRPVPKERKDSCFGYTLKFYIAEQLWGHDGSLSGDWVTVNNDILSYLKGVRAGTNNKELKTEIDKLERLIEKYDEIQLKLE